MTFAFFPRRENSRCPDEHGACDRLAADAANLFARVVQPAAAYHRASTLRKGFTLKIGIGDLYRRDPWEPDVYPDHGVDRYLLSSRRAATVA